MAELILDDIEVRVLGSLMEKSMTTPEYYPLSLNALTNACNQKSNREPVVAYHETTVMQALDSLREKQLVVLSASSRVEKFAELLVTSRKLVKREAALLTILMLRGPQTVGELRGRTERIYRFEDLAEVESTLEELCDMGYVAKLPRMVGRKEPRYAHLLAGNVEVEPEGPQTAPRTAALTPDRIAGLEEEMRLLRQELAALQAEFEKFRHEFD